MKKQKNKKPFHLVATLETSCSTDIFYLYGFDMISKKVYFLEWYKRLEIMKNKDFNCISKNTIVNNIPYSQFVCDLYNLMYGSLISAIFSVLEFDVNTIAETNGLHLLEALKLIEKNHYVKYKETNSFTHINELRKLNNDYKHNARIYRGNKSKPPKVTVFGGVEEFDYTKLDIVQILSDCEAFLNEISSKVGEAINIQRNSNT